MGQVRIASTPKQSSLYVGWGVFLVVAGVPLILAAGLLLGPQVDPKPLVWAGLIVSISGAISLAVGATRWAEHADRKAGVLAAVKVEVPTTNRPADGPL